MAQNDLLNVFNLNLNKKIFLQLRKNFDQATSLMVTNVSDLSTSKRLLKDNMHANSIKPAKVNVNSVMIVSVNCSFSCFVLFKQKLMK